MDESEIPVAQELQELANELVAMAPVEALPLEALPVQAVAAVGWVTRLLVLASHHAPLLAFLGAFIENTVLLGFLLPGGTAVMLAGAGARAAGVPLPVVVVLAALGMTAGALVDYWLGWTGAARLLRHPRAGRIGRRLADELERTAPLLRHHGWWMMLVAHAFGHGRSSMAVAAGGARLPLRRFLAIEAPAATLWAALYAGGGYFLAAEWDRLELVLRRAGWVGAAMVVVGVVAWWGGRRLSRRMAVRAPAEDHHPPPPAPAALAAQRSPGPAA